jgi:hypothetical protein
VTNEKRGLVGVVENLRDSIDDFCSVMLCGGVLSSP